MVALAPATVQRMATRSSRTPVRAHPTAVASDTYRHYTPLVVASRRFRIPWRAPLLASWYFIGAVFLTPAWLVAHSLAPDVGLTRSFYYRLPRDANPLGIDVRTMTVVEGSADGVDLAFLDEFGWLTQDYFVRWRGVWFSPREERIELHASADDGVVVRVDGTLLIEQHPAVGTHSAVRTIGLAPGAHTLEIDYWQREGDRHLSVQWAPEGSEPAPLDSDRLFPVDPGALGYWLRAVAQRPMLVLFVWAGSPADPARLAGLASDPRTDGHGGG